MDSTKVDQLSTFLPIIRRRSDVEMDQAEEEEVSSGKSTYFGYNKLRLSIFAGLAILVTLLFVAGFSGITIIQISSLKRTYKEVAEGYVNEMVRSERSPLTMNVEEILSESFASKVFWRLQMLAKREDRALYDFLLSKFCNSTYN